LKRDVEVHDLAGARGAVGSCETEGGWLGHDG
jgi:hypothetical protein